MALLSGGAVVFLVGLLDDALGSRFHWGLKAAGQVLGAAILVFGGDVRTSFLPTEWLNVALTLVWIVGMTNAFNLLDNMDGLSAGVAFVASGVFLVNAWALGEFFIALLLVAFMGSLLGFLFFNFNPASTFLGDCGSLFIGYVMGSLTLLERYVSHASSSYFPVLMPVLVLAVPILDTATVVAIRLREGRPIYVGDSRHLSHRLVSLGFSPRAAVLFLYLVTLTLGLGAASLTDATPFQTGLILLQSLGVVALLLILLFFERRRGAREEQEAA
jgi:UDP-GlcNAc:undecaprenyl-phosphate GlcNAc-1-phosphate transferase